MQQEMSSAKIGEWTTGAENQGISCVCLAM